MSFRRRVAVYVLRRQPSGLQVLVFDHIDFPEAGTQIPAGGVDAGEDMELAAFREVFEETGLGQMRLIGEVGTQDRPHPHSGVQRRTTFFAALTDWPESEWEHTVTGPGEDSDLRFRCYFLPVIAASLILGDHQGEFLKRALNLVP